MDRRQFLKTTAGTLGVMSSSLACGGTEGPPGPSSEPEPDDGAELVDLDPESVPEDETLFARGVQAGAMTSSSALLWTHRSDRDPTRLLLWREAAEPGRIKLVKDLSLLPEDGFCRSPVDGLGPGHYRYAFFDEAMTRRSRVGRFRTAFAEGDKRLLRIAGLACTNFERRPYRSLEETAKLDVDLILHLGDMAYNDGAVSLEDYRDRWRMTFEEPGYQAAYASAGYYATWDDHELDGDFDPETMDPDQLAAAKQAFFETTVVEHGPDDRLWRSYRWGATAEIFVLDCRSERLPSTRLTDDPIYMSPAQLQWLTGAMEESPCTFKILMNSVPITRFPELWDLALKDRWQGYDRQRQALIEAIASRSIQNVYFLTGDFHCAFISRVDPSGPGRSLYELAVGPSAPLAPNPLAILADSGNLPVEDVFPPDQFLFGSGNRYATTELVFDPFLERVYARYVSTRERTFGEVLFSGYVPDKPWF